MLTRKKVIHNEFYDGDQSIVTLHLFPSLRLVVYKV